MLKGFRDFITRGNVIDLAVGVILGLAFGGIVDSLTKDIIAPVLGMLGGKADFSEYRPGGIGIGSFVTAVINFLIKAAGLYFLIVLPFNRLAARISPPPPPQENFLKEIRDLLRAQAPRGQEAR